MITLRREETGVLVMELSEHLGPRTSNQLFRSFMTLLDPTTIRFCYLL